MVYFVEVFLPLALPKPFTYRISENEFNFIKPGMRIAVPFGKNKIYTGIAVGVHQNPPTLYEAKEIHQIIDNVSLVTEIQLEHWQWIASYYMCAIGEVYRAAVPNALLLESETKIIAKSKEDLDTKLLSDDEYLVYEALQHQSSLSIQELMSIVNKKSVLPLIQRLIEKEILTVEEEIQENYKPKMVRYVRLNEKYETKDGLNNLLEVLKNANKQKEIILSYFQLIATEKKPVTVKKLIEYSKSTSSIIKSLLDKEILEEYYIQHNRIENDNLTSLKKIALSEAQEKAQLEILNQFQKKDVCLLHGVTSSGKTEIYIKIIESFLEKNLQVLYLLPEIALTVQLVNRLRAYFGNKVAVFHSKYSGNERVEIWNQVLQKKHEAQIIIGARSALFLPFQNLGCIIIDEEHEQTFKQTDPAPRYHARDAAIVLAKLHQAKVLLGSATPSIESYHNARSDKYGLVTIKERFGKSILPEIVLIDLKDQYFRKKMTGHFSHDLIEAIGNTLSQGEQIILFQNRRGFAPLLECITCGHIPQCQQCDVSLTYHKFKGQLRCHYCGYTIAKPTHCHACSSVELTTKGFGTEQIQLELETLFPTSKIGRMDQDTTRGKFGFEKIIDSFKNREIDILVGTQMLAKGLDFDNVSLVGIMNADNMLYHPDFRAFERSFQMMTQVAGRAGRSDKKGTVYIQTYTPTHSIIQQVKQNEYETMVLDQLTERQVYHYPPFYKLIKITFRHKDFEKVKDGALWFNNVCRQHLNMPILGPEEPPINRIRNEYIRTLLIKIPLEISINNTKKTIQRLLNSFEAVPNFRSIRVTINVDFY